ncbi:DUF4214 domain-containing protein [Candidatus Arthromitus sp. SFB-turkey]|uniref:DUF4214 domain-containing protein n=1 Tax=Candidatus Arthromitus sp. SFB-turkey TaxID=1840217 RepID=UPI0007F33EAE|nr:DUF4214 domain-containing protein [Candidatus Arthromitus sp. SFB-turkey]OAT88255.1 hypothetical protein A6P36_06520 [Candidatus Arthromitus sp. SFB-turkey]
MLSKKFTKKLVGMLMSILLFSTFCVGPGTNEAFAVPASEDRYIEGDKQFSVNLSSTEIPAGANPGAVDFNGNGKYDDGEVLPLKGTEDFTVPSSVTKEEENFIDVVGVEGGILRNNTVVIREDIEDYKKTYLRDISTSGYIYVKVKFGGNVAAALKSTLDKAVEEVKKNKTLLSQGKGSQISLIDQETLATVIQNSLGMVNDSKELINKDVYLAVSYTTGSKSEVKKIPIQDWLMDTTTAKMNQYTNSYNAPKIVDEAGNVYLKIYGLPSGSEITKVQLEGTLSFPSLVEQSVVKKISQQSKVTEKSGIIPFIDPMLTESINIDNSNSLDPLTIKSTVSYFVDISVNSKGELTTDGNNTIEYLGPFSDDDEAHGYEHANVRPLEDAIAFYDVIYDPENTIKRIQVKDSEGNLYSAKILKEDTKIGKMQSYAKVDDLVKDPEKNSTNYKDFAIEELKPGTDYKFTELIVTFNSGDGDINRRFTNYDPISVNPIVIRTMGSSPDTQSGELLKSFELKNITPTKAEFKIEFNDPDGVVKDVRIEGDSIASSVYDSKNDLVKLYGLTPNSEQKGFELVVTLVDGEELGMELEPFTTKRVTNAKDWIEGFYHIFFLRDGDPDGMAYWTSKLSSHELTVNYFTANIVNEKEYKEKNLDNAKYVERMYRSVTGRTSDAEGLAWWVKTLEQTIVELGDRTAAMQNISARMLGESETKNFLYSIGLKVE